MAPKTNLKLASFDGGDARGLSQLEIMDAIMHRLTWDSRSNESNGSDLPCDRFDLIGGSGTGGLIAILLTKLRMSVEEASEEFEDIITHVFNPKDISGSQRTEVLRKCMEDILKRKGLPVDLRLTEDKQEGCPSFVVASLRTNTKSTICLRTYPVRNQRPSTITVIDAVLATCATQPDFAPVTSGSGRKTREYIAASGALNPIHEVISEAHLLFGGDATVASLLSIGAGHPGIISLPQGDGEAAIHKVMRDMLHDCEQRAQEIEERIGRVGVYSRLSVDQGMQNTHPGKFDDPSWITTQTEDYLGRHETGEKLDVLAHNFGAENGPITLDQLKHAGGPSVLGHIATIIQKSHEILISNQDDDIITKLKPKDLECEPHVEMCLEGTRQDVLERFRTWAMDLEAPNILWISGYPGVGKSAIASTIIEELRSSSRLGSSFFFRRERASAMTPNALWCTVAYDLSQRYLNIRKHVVTALNQDSSLPTTSNVDALFRVLIYEPLTKSDNIPTEKLPVIVLDALDECGGIDGWRSGDRRNLIKTLKRWPELPGRFKFIITSRRESDIEQFFSKTVHRSIDIAAGETATSVSISDIRIFLEHELRPLQDRYSLLPVGWPGEEAILWLVDHAKGLFIWIKTVIMLLWRGEPQRTLRQVVNNGTGGMADLYTLVIHASFPSPSEHDIRDFRAVMGAIIFTKEALNKTSLAYFLSIDGATIEYILTGLQSVLDCRSTIRIHHQSFVDFLLNPNECPPSFLIDLRRESRNLALCCLATMKRHLKFNICELQSSHFRNEDVPNLALRAETCIPPYLSYSSRFWASHLAEIASDSEVYVKLKYFLDHLFLFWLEVMSLIQQSNVGSHMLQCLTGWLRKSNQDDSLALDMQKFVTAFASVMSQSTPHIYISALPFAPRYLGVSKQYLSHYRQTMAVWSGGYRSWPAIQNICIGHKASVWSVAFSPDGRRISSGSGDHTIRVWDVETGQTVLGPLQGHIGSVLSVSFSPDGKRIVSGSRDHTIRVWDAETGEKVLGPLRGHTASVNSVSLSPDGRRIVSGSYDHTIRVWDAETGETVLGPLQGHNDSDLSVSLSPDGKRVVSGSKGGAVRVWDAETGQTVLGPLKGHSVSVESVSFSPDGKRIVSGSSDHMILVWDAETGKRILGPLRGHTSLVNSVSLSPDGKRFVAGSRDHTIQVWDVETSEKMLGPLQGHTNWVLSLLFSPDGKRIVSGSADRTIRIWSADTGETIVRPLQGPEDSVLSVSFSPDGRQIVSGSSGDTIRVWDAETGQAVLGPLRGHCNSTQSASFSPDGKRIVSGSRDHTIRVWDAKTGEKIVGPFQGHTDWVLSVSFSPDGNRIVSGSSDDTIRVWDAETGKTILGPLQGHTNPVYSVSFSPDGKRIVSGSRDHTIRVWDAETGNGILGPLQGHTDSVESVSFSPDGKRIVSGSSDHTIRVWDTETGETMVGPLRGRANSVYSVSFSPDGKRIVSGSSDDMIRVWDAETGKTILGPLQGHTDSVYSVSFSPDGKRIVSGSKDHTIRVWDVETGEATVESLQGSNIDLESVSSFSAANPLSSASDDRTVRLLDSENKSNGRLTDIYAIFRNNAETKDGWIRGPNSELLFWVPPDIRPRLCALRNILVIDSRRVWTILDLEHFVHGEEWSRCQDRRVT